MAHKLTQQYKFAARTSPELYEAINGYILRVAASGAVKFRGRKLGVEAAINAVLMAFMDQGEEARLAMLARYVPRFEATLEGSGAAAGLPGDGFAAAIDPATGKGRRKRRGGKAG